MSKYKKTATLFFYFLKAKCISILFIYIFMLQFSWSNIYKQSMHTCNKIYCYFKFQFFTYHLSSVAHHATLRMKWSWRIHFKFTNLTWCCSDFIDIVVCLKREYPTLPFLYVDNYNYVHKQGKQWFLRGGWQLSVCIQHVNWCCEKLDPTIM